ncbi:hypothetical protein STENM327S_02349 [Streptomyces tendae]
MEQCGELAVLELVHEGLGEGQRGSGAGDHHGAEGVAAGRGDGDGRCGGRGGGGAPVGHDGAYQRGVEPSRALDGAGRGEHGDGPVEHPLPLGRLLGVEPGGRDRVVEVAVGVEVVEGDGDGAGGGGVGERTQGPPGGRVDGVGGCRGGEGCRMAGRLARRSGRRRHGTRLGAGALLWPGAGRPGDGGARCAAEPADRGRRRTGQVRPAGGAGHRGPAGRGGAGDGRCGGRAAGQGGRGAVLALGREGQFAPARRGGQGHRQSRPRRRQSDPAEGGKVGRPVGERHVEGRRRAGAQGGREGEQVQVARLRPQGRPRGGAVQPAQHVGDPSAGGRGGQQPLDRFRGPLGRLLEHGPGIGGRGQRGGHSCQPVEERAQQDQSAGPFRPFQEGDGLHVTAAGGQFREESLRHAEDGRARLTGHGRGPPVAGAGRQAPAGARPGPSRERRAAGGDYSARAPPWPS